MKVQIRINLDLPLTELTEQDWDALHNLADVCFVQTEDGLYSTGSPDSGDFITDFAGRTVEVVEVVDRKGCPKG